MLLLQRRLRVNISAITSERNFCTKTWYFLIMLHYPFFSPPKLEYVRAAFTKRESHFKQDGWLKQPWLLDDIQLIIIARYDRLLAPGYRQKIISQLWTWWCLHKKRKLVWMWHILSIFHQSQSQCFFLCVIKKRSLTLSKSFPHLGLVQETKFMVFWGVRWNSFTSSFITFKYSSGSWHLETEVSKIFVAL